MQLPLTLLVTRIRADHPDAPMPSDDPTLFAHLFRGRSYFHLYLQTIRPLVGSYADNSTSTRSPGRILMRRILIFPETCASTSKPPSISTLNIAFGRFWTTVPWTRMTSSSSVTRNWSRRMGSEDRRRMVPVTGQFYQINRFFCERHHFNPVPGDGDGVLEMGRKRPVERPDSPSVGVHGGLPAPEVEHRFDADCHPGFQLHAPTGLAHVGDLRFFVHVTTDAVADI